MTARDKNQPIPLPITCETAIAWFRQTKSSKFPGEATDGDVSSFVKIVNDLPAYTERELKIIDPELPIEQLIEFDELNATEFKEVLSFQHALTTLRQKLPDVINTIQRNDMDPLGLHRLNN